jgi:hypothetical protein
MATADAAVKWERLLSTPTPLQNGEGRGALAGRRIFAPWAEVRPRRAIAVPRGPWPGATS